MRGCGCLSECRVSLVSRTKTTITQPRPLDASRSKPHTHRQVEESGSFVIDCPRFRIGDLERAGLTPELAENLAEAKHVVFIDAAADLAPGTLVRREIARNTNPDMCLVHFLSPESLREWTARPYDKTPRAEIWLMGPAATGLSEQLTPAIAAEVPRVVEQLEVHLRHLLAEVSEAQTP